MWTGFLCLEFGRVNILVDLLKIQEILKSNICFAHRLPVGVQESSYVVTQAIKGDTIGNYSAVMILSCIRTHILFCFMGPFIEEIYYA